MNINLISPTDLTVKNNADKTNGHRYTIRFKEDIIIPANSKIQLNFATLSRQSEISFLDDQILYINIPAEIAYTDDTGARLYKNILPTNKFDADTTDTPGTQNFDGNALKLSSGNKYAVDIAKGFYTFDKFYDTLREGINKALDFKADGTTPTTSNNRNYRACESLDTNPQNTVNPGGTITKNVNLTESAVISIALLENVEFTTNRAFNIEEINMFDFVAHGVHKKNAGVGGDGEVYVKTNTTTTDPTAPANQTGQRIFDSYAMGVHNYRHTGLNDNTPLSAQNIFRVETNKTYEQIGTSRACVGFGLGSQEVANGMTGVNGVYPDDAILRTHGSVSANGSYPIQQSYYKQVGGNDVDSNFSNERKIPTAFITVLITAEQDAQGNGGGNPKLEIYTGKSARVAGTNGWDIGNFRSIHEPFIGTRTDGQRYFFQRKRRIDLGTHGYVDTDLIEVGLQTYQVRGSKSFSTNKQKTYYRILNLRKADYSLPISQQKDIIMYDSFSEKDKNNYFSQNYFFCDTTANLDYTKGTAGVINNKVASQQGLTPMLWSNTEAFGFNQCSYRGLPKGNVDGVDYSANPMTLYNEYYLSATEEMAELFNITTDYDASKVSNTDPLGFLCPNTAVPQKQTTYSELSKGWRSRSYSVYLRGIPLQNYKNKSTHTQGGFAKQIMANVPLPFKDSLDHYNIKTTGLFMPSNPVVSHLYNQDMVVNKFEIDIKNMTNDKDATEIEESVINFTIIPPDDYSGNVNAVAGFKKLPKSVVSS